MIQTPPLNMRTLVGTKKAPKQKQSPNRWGQIRNTSIKTSKAKSSSWNAHASVSYLSKGLVSLVLSSCFENYTWTWPEIDPQCAYMKGLTIFVLGVSKSSWEVLDVAAIFVIIEASTVHRVQYYPQPYTPQQKQGPSKPRITLTSALFGPHFERRGFYGRRLPYYTILYYMVLYYSRPYLTILYGWQWYLAP